MASIKDTKDLAKEIGLHVPNSLTNEEQLKLIADQLGVKDYRPSEQSNNNLYNLLKDKQLHMKIPVKTVSMVNVTTTQTDEIIPPKYETLHDDTTPQTTNPKESQPLTNNNQLESGNPDNNSKKIDDSYNNHKNDPEALENELDNLSNKTEDYDGDYKKDLEKNANEPENNASQQEEPETLDEEENPETEEPVQNVNNQGDNNNQTNKEKDDNNSNDHNDKNDGNENKTNDEKTKDNNQSDDKKDDLDKNKKQEDNTSSKETKQSPEKKADSKDSKPADNKKSENKLSNNTPNQNDTLKNKVGQKNNRRSNSDITKNGRKNIEQAKKAKNATKQATSAPKKEMKKKAGETAKKGAKAIGNGIKTAAKAVAGFIKNTIIPIIMANPWILAVFALLLFLIIVIIVVILGGDPKIGHNTGYQGTQCSYDLNGVVNTGNVTLNDVVVELINCDGRPNNYTVLETVDFEKYALGVALAQMGEDAPDEAIKAQIIVARNFALTRNSTMCLDDPENCFYGYNISTGKIRMRACDLDQVYWDYEKPIYTDETSGVKKYSPEATSSNGLLWKLSLTGERRDEVLALAREVKGKVLLDSEDKVLKITSSLAAVNNIFSLAYEGKVYEEILASSYGSNNVNTSTCSSIGNIDFGDYNLNSDGDSILHKNLATFLSEQGSSLEEFNALIAKNVNNSGYGTRAGVVSAAVTLVAELGNRYDVKIPYFWGGGHSGGISEYADPTWGSNSCHTYANSQNYNYCGLDCTGFVSWALHNGGYNLNSARGNFYKMDGAKKINLSDTEAVLQAGDLLESKSHVVMVIGVDNDRRQYICVEASGNEDGIWFTRRPFAPNGYWGVLMDDYYNDGSNVRS